MALPDEWTEVAYVAISDEDGNQYQFGVITDTVELGLGARDIEAIATVSAGRVVKKIPEEVTEISLEVFPVGMSSDDTPPNGMLSWYMGLAPTASSGINQFSRKRFRVTVLWSDTTVTDAAGAIDSGNSFRISFWNCFLTDMSLDFTDDILKSKVTFKCPPYNKSAEGTIKAEEADSAILATLGAYDGSAPA